MIRPIRILTLAGAAVILSGCSDDFFDIHEGTDGAGAVEFSGRIEQLNRTRADENGFADGDRFGLYMMLQRNGSTGALTDGEPYASNVSVRYDGASDKWNSTPELLWPDATTSARFCAYYPYRAVVSDLLEMPIEVAYDQNSTGSEGIGGYESSDLLWASVDGIKPGQSVNLTFTHRMAGVRVILEHGESIADTEWLKLSKQVTVDNAVRTATFNLNDGTVSAAGTYDRNIRMAKQPDCYRAVLPPQTVDAGTNIIGITIDKTTYGYRRGEASTFQSGKLHTFTLKVEKKEGNGDYEVKLTGEEISDWVNDEVSHQFEANAYFTVESPEAGKLSEALKSAYGSTGNYSEVKNLKITGEMNDDDFRFIREELTQITSLNIKDVKMRGVKLTSDEDNSSEIVDDKLPDEALSRIGTLRRVVLPEEITRIGRYALSHLQLFSTLVIPESVKHIEEDAFESVSDDCTIEFPSSLEVIEYCAFYGCQAHMEFNVPSTLKYLGDSAFKDCRNLTGTYQIPENIEYLGSAFAYASQFEAGDVVVPSSFSEWNRDRAPGFSKGTRVYLHDGILKIGGAAFAGYRFNNDLKLPKNLAFIGEGAFEWCHFQGPVELPSGLRSLGNVAFLESNFMGDLVIPEGVMQIPAGCFGRTQITSLTIGNNLTQIDREAFMECGRLLKISVGKNIDYIGERAFAGLRALNTMVCLAETPPDTHQQAFQDCEFSKTVLEVPEKSVEAYRRHAVWGQFKNITAHHELAINIKAINCLNAGQTRTGVVRSEGEWEVISSPSWVSITPTSGRTKSEVTVNVTANTGGSRSGEVVIKLKDKDYTVTVPVCQSAYEYPEDKEIILQRASGPGQAIPLFVIGEGFDAASILDGTYMRRMEDHVEQFFSLEPFKTYRNYFTVSTAIACSPDAGLSGYSSGNASRFGVTEGDFGYDAGVFTDYAVKVSSGISRSNLSKAMILVVVNADMESGQAHKAETCNIAFCPISSRVEASNPARIVLRTACGEVFGKLAVEESGHNEFVKACTCPYCMTYASLMQGKARGWYENVTVSAKMASAPWADFIFDPKYSAIVDMYEGGWGHLRGVWRSENRSVMAGDYPYFNTISRYSIYKRIMNYAGLTPTMADFKANDRVVLP